MIVEFSGWCQIDDSKVKFQHFDDDKIINGEEYLKLTDDEKDEYIIENVMEAIRDSYDNEWDHINVLGEEEGEEE